VEADPNAAAVSGNEWVARPQAAGTNESPQQNKVKVALRSMQGSLMTITDSLARVRGAAGVGHHIAIEAAPASIGDSPIATDLARKRIVVDRQCGFAQVEIQSITEQIGVGVSQHSLPLALSVMRAVTHARSARLMSALF